MVSEVRWRVIFTYSLLNNLRNFTKPDAWIKWKQRFELFPETSGLPGAAETGHVSNLLYMIGKNADNVLTSTGISEDDRKIYIRC